MTETTLIAADVRPSAPPVHRWSGWTTAVIVTALACELLLVSLAYRSNFTFNCRAVGPAWLCAALSGGVLRATTASAAIAALLAARPAIRRALAFRPKLSFGWAGAHMAGFALIMGPWAFLTDAASPSVFALAVFCWIAGLALAGGAATLAVAPPSSWTEAATTAGFSGVVILALALAAPEIAEAAQWIWKWPLIAEATFAATAALLGLTGVPVTANPDLVELGVGDFIVLVGRQCSGVEGFALITGFLALYCWLFRDLLRFPRALVLFPLGLILSWSFNVVRITLLVLIGAFVSPDLAINGFHSHAGWLMFTVLSVSLATIVHMSRWFHRAAPLGPAASKPPPPPLFQDPVAALILPFAIFMASALLASTFTQTPTVIYPLRALAVTATLALFWPAFRAMAWRVHWEGPLLGLAVGLAWIWTAPPPAATDIALATALDALPATLFALWAAARVFGTVALAPLVEELFFRGYILMRLGAGGPVQRVVALAVSSGLFAALHDRWLAAALAGLIFGLLALRRGRLSDAIAAHATANAAIAAQALLLGDWHLI